MANKKREIKPLIAKDIMTKDVLKVQTEWSLRSLAEFLIENSISGAPVTDEGGKLMGVVSITDILCNDVFPLRDYQSYGAHDFYFHLLDRQFAPQEIESFQFRNEPQITVGDIMTPSIFRVDENTKIQDVAKKMISSHIHRIFVIRDEKIVGIISAVDMIKIVRDL